MSKHDPLAHICPLCGQSNLCSMAKVSASDREKQSHVHKEQQNQSCWCMSQAKLAAGKRFQNENISSKRCLCQKCLQQEAQAQQ